LLLQRGWAVARMRRGTGADRRRRTRTERQWAAAPSLSRPCSEERRAREGRGMRNVGAGGDEAHRQVSGHQHLLQQQGCTEVQRRQQGVSVDSPHTGTRSAASPLLLASHSTECGLTTVYVASPTDLCSMCCFALSPLNSAKRGKFVSRLLPRIVEDSSSAADRVCNCTAEEVDSASSSAREKSCCDALVLRRTEEGAAAILSNSAAEAAVCVCEHACTHQLFTGHCSTHVCIVSNLCCAHSMCVGCARDAKSERSEQG
jgi:hypothetical protein